MTEAKSILMRVSIPELAILMTLDAEFQLPSSAYKRGHRMRAAKELLRRDVYEPDPKPEPEIAREGMPQALERMKPLDDGIRRPHTVIEGVAHYLCGDCCKNGDRSYKPETSFRRLCNPASKCGLMSVCKSCEDKRRMTNWKKKRAEMLRRFEAIEEAA